MSLAERVQPNRGANKGPETDEPQTYTAPNGEIIQLRDYSYERFASHPAIFTVDAALAEYMPTGSGTFIDNGCGTGAMTAHMRDQGKLQSPFQIVLVDPDGNALRIAKPKFGRDSSKTKRFHFVQGVSENLPLNTGIALAAVDGNSIHLTDAVKTYQENFRILKEGGVLAVSSAYVPPFAYPEGPDGQVWMTLGMLAKRELKAMGYTTDVPSPVNLMKYTEEDHVRMATEAGFTDVKVIEHTVAMDEEAIKAICTYAGFAEGSLPGVPVPLAVEALIRAVPKAFARMNRGRDGLEGRPEPITKIRRGWMFLIAVKPYYDVAVNKQALFEQKAA